VPEAHDFAFTSRGDPVSGRLWLPESAGPHPLALVTAGLGDGAGAAPRCEALAANGVAAACFDLPLQGARASRKLSDRLLRAVRSEAPTRAEAQLVEAFRKQVAADLSAARAVLLARSDLDGGRLACLALEPGAEAAAAWGGQIGVTVVRCAPSDAGGAIAELAATLRR
jgi:dienelactone hydrolase